MYITQINKRIDNKKYLRSHFLLRYNVSEIRYFALFYFITHHASEF